MIFLGDWERHDDDYGLVLYYGTQRARVVAVTTRVQDPQLSWDPTVYEYPFFRARLLPDGPTVTCMADMLRTEPSEDSRKGKPLSALPEIRKYGWIWREEFIDEKEPIYRRQLGPWRKMLPVERLAEEKE